MKIRNNIFGCVLTIAALLLPACTVVEEIREADGRIRFRATLDKNTKAVEARMYNLSRISVSSTIMDGADTLEWFDSQIVDVSPSGDCTESSGETCYWPKEGALDFYAYGPLDGDGKYWEDGQIVRNSWKSFSVTPADEMSAQTDFVFAYAPNLTQATSEGEVMLGFKHAESRVSLYVMNSEATLFFVVKGWGIGNVHGSGDFDFSGKLGEDGHLLATDWKGSGKPDGRYCWTGASKIPLYYTDACPMPENMIIVPQSLNCADGYDEDGSLDGAYLFVTMDIYNECYEWFDDPWEQEVDFVTPIRENVTCCWPAYVDLKPGYSYTYCLDLAEGGYYETDRDGDGKLDKVLGDPRITYARPDVEEWGEPADLEIPLLKRHGSLEGIFSVSDSTKVRFSMGNLYYDDNDRRFELFGEQYWSTVRLWRDSKKNCAAFSWGLGEWSGYELDWFEDETGTPGLEPAQDLTHDKDWGSAISSENYWHTLTSSEWEYLLSDVDVRKGKNSPAIIEANDSLYFGMLLIPDDWLYNGYVFEDEGYWNGPYLALDDNTWRILEFYGAVFLPSYYQSPTAIDYYEDETFSFGYYQRDCDADEQKAHYLYMNIDEENSEYYNDLTDPEKRCFVRLVHYAEE